MATSDPKTTWEIAKQLCAIRGLKRTRYHTVNTRIKALTNTSYLRKAGEKETKAGAKATLFEITAKALFALVLDSLSLDDLINDLDEITATTFTSLIAATINHPDIDLKMARN
jgi:hypothetical protein